MLTSLIVTVRRLAEGNNTEHVAGGAQVSPQRAEKGREEIERENFRSGVVSALGSRCERKNIGWGEK